MLALHSILRSISLLLKVITNLRRIRYNSKPGFLILFFAEVYLFERRKVRVKFVFNSVKEIALIKRRKKIKIYS